MFKTIVVIQLLFFSELTNGKSNRQNTNTDFLLHEAGGAAIDTSKNFNLAEPNYDSQFPSLGKPTGSQTTKQSTNNSPTTSTTASLPSAKRDYVAPQRPTQTPNSATKPLNTPQSGKQEYDSQFPSLGGSTANSHPTTKPQSSGKRDYVAPQHSTPKPSSSGGNVKDLVNFYDGMNKNGPQGIPSYSSIAQGSNNNNKQGATSPTSTVRPNAWSNQTPKPISSSTVVAGSNKPSVTPTAATQKPTSRRPGSPVLPSEIVNNNRNSNGPSNSRNSATDSEIKTISEELLRKDVNNAAKYVTVNYQGKTSSGSIEDKAPQPLFTVAPAAWNIPTIEKFIPLLDNYERDTLVNEHVTPQERNEENAFMDAIMSTTVIRHLMNFLKEKGYVTPDPKQQRDFMKQLWFSLYSRGKGKISSSGFEHIFVSELKNREVSGLHNWIYFAREEAANRVNYLGYLKYLQLNDKGVVMKLHFNQLGVDKPVDSMFIGTSPELEMALYTLCFVTRADNDCELKLATKDVKIISHTFRYRSKNLIGSAYPQI